MSRRTSLSQKGSAFMIVMAGLVPAIHDCLAESLVDARAKRGHDDLGARAFQTASRHAPSFPRQDVPEWCGRFATLEIRGRRESRMPAAPEGPVRQSK
jgi:hypothetical protein